MQAMLQYSGMGKNNFQKSKLYSLERNALETLDLNYFYPTEYIDDPMNIGKHYEPNEIVDLLYDIDDFSQYQ